jgi:2-oxoglutarate ferredoxin oxidoreductase subunit alpha
LRPITVSPYPYRAIDELAASVSGFLVTEMNMGQMYDDVRLAVRGRVPVEFYGRTGGMVPFPDEILSEIRRIAAGQWTTDRDPRDAWQARMASLLVR